MTTRACAYGLQKPLLDGFYTRVDRESRYKAKAFIDTAVWRFGDLVTPMVTPRRSFERAHTAATFMRQVQQQSNAYSRFVCDAPVIVGSETAKRTICVFERRVPQHATAKQNNMYSSKPRLR